MAHAHYIHAAVEDFGIAPVEAQAAGTPVIGLGVGGLRETIRGLDAVRPTGLFFAEQTAAAVRDAVERFERVRGQVDPADCRANPTRFAPEKFRDGFRVFVQRALQQHSVNSPNAGFGSLAAAE